jgi:hypothetical protein
MGPVPETLPPVEIAAGEMQLRPADPDALLRAEAAGLTVSGAAAAWTAHDIVSAAARAWVVLAPTGPGRARVAAVAAPAGSGADAAAAREVVRRYAHEALGLADG